METTCLNFLLGKIYSNNRIHVCILKDLKNGRYTVLLVGFAIDFDSNVSHILLDKPIRNVDLSASTWYQI